MPFFSYGKQLEKTVSFLENLKRNVIETHERALETFAFGPDADANDLGKISEILLNLKSLQNLKLGFRFFFFLSLIVYCHL